MQRLSEARVPRELIERHSPEQPICIVGRFSQPYAWTHSVNDFMAAVDYAATCGLDVSEALPSREDLADMLKASKAVKSVGRNGEEFINWYLTIDLRESHGVVCILSCGSGHKLNEHGRQPFVERLAELVEEHHIVALFASRIDRLTRVSWAFAPVMIALEYVDGFLADARRGFTRVAGPESILTFFEARSAEAEAAKMPAQTRRGQRDLTDREVVDGRFRLGVGYAVPPGFYSYRELKGSGLGYRFVSFDTPSCLPEDSEAMVGVPQVHDEDGERVDQVANVRWAIAMLGRPGMGYREVALGLLERRFSTEAIRRYHGPSATVTNDMVGQGFKRITDQICKHLEVYETGVMPITFGATEVAPVEVSGCFPPDGEPWGSEDDFARIRAYSAATDRAPKRGLSFSRIPVEIDGEACYFATHSYARPDGTNRQCLGAVLAEPYSRGLKFFRPKVKVHLPPDLLTRALADAIMNAGDQTAALVRDLPPAEVDASFDRNISMARNALRSLEEEQSALRRQLLERDGDGEPRLTGALLRDVNDRYNELADIEVPRAKQALAAAEHAAADALRDAEEGQEGAKLATLLHLVASLRDPYNLQYRDLLKRSVRDCKLSSSLRGEGDERKLVLAVSFSFVIEDGGKEVILPVSVEFVDGAEFVDKDLAEELLEQLKRSPVLLRECVAKDRHYKSACEALARLLKINNRKFMLPRVEIPEMAQLVARVLDAQDLDSLADATGEAPEFLRRIHEVHTSSPQARWRSGGWSPLMARMYDIVAEGRPLKPEDLEDGLFDRLHQRLQMHRHRRLWRFDGKARTWSLAPCQHCSSPRLRPAVIPEPVGLVCMDCRLDAAGFSWPAEPFDAYLVPSEATFIEAARASTEANGG